MRITRPLSAASLYDWSNWGFADAGKKAGVADGAYHWAVSGERLHELEQQLAPPTP